ncbi:MAG: phage portal protein, partial [Nitrospirota bacterium]|nr:phage portal protein [Nitrospirota bacterium]
MGVLSTLLSIVPRRRELPAAPAAVVLPVGPALPARREGVRGALARKRPARSKRYYTAGNNAEFLSWNPGMVSADSAIYQNLNLMKARARDLARNNDYVVQFLRLLKANV